MWPVAVRGRAQQRALVSGTVVLPDSTGRMDTAAGLAGRGHSGQRPWAGEETFKLKGLVRHQVHDAPSCTDTLQQAGVAAPMERIGRWARGMPGLLFN